MYIFSVCVLSFYTAKCCSAWIIDFFHFSLVQYKVDVSLLSASRYQCCGHRIVDESEYWFRKSVENGTVCDESYHDGHNYSNKKLPVHIFMYRENWKYCNTRNGRDNIYIRYLWIFQKSYITLIVAKWTEVSANTVEYCDSKLISDETNTELLNYWFRN